MSRGMVIIDNCSKSTSSVATTVTPHFDQRQKSIHVRNPSGTVIDCHCLSSSMGHPSKRDRMEVVFEHGAETWLGLVALVSHEFGVAAPAWVPQEGTLRKVRVLEFACFHRLRGSENATRGSVFL